jgi:hypothetical protein
MFSSLRGALFFFAKVKVESKRKEEGNRGVAWRRLD